MINPERLAEGKRFKTTAMHPDDEGLPPHMEIANIQWRLAYLRAQQAKQKARQKLLQYCYGVIVIAGLGAIVTYTHVTGGDMFAALLVLALAILALIVIVCVRSLQSAEGREQFDKMLREEVHHPSPAYFQRSITAWEKRLAELEAHERSISS